MAARFKFRYEQYLKLKKKIEEDKALDFAKAMALLRKEEKQLLELENKKLLHMMMQATVGGKSIQNLRSSSNYIIQLNEDIIVQQKRIIDAKKESEKRRLILNDAMKDRKIIDKLKEKKLENHKAEYKKNATNEEGEIALQITRRRK